MRLLKFKYQPKLNAFSLFESVIAVSIISIVSAIGATVLSNVSRSEKGHVYFEAKEEVDLRFHQLKTEQNFVSTSFESENFSVEQTISPYKNQPDLWQVTYTAKSGSEILFIENHLVKNE